jgi:hypothetical protein
MPGLVPGAGVVTASMSGRVRVSPESTGVGNADGPVIQSST